MVPVEKEGSRKRQTARIGIVYLSMKEAVKKLKRLVWAETSRSLPADGTSQISLAKIL